MEILERTCHLDHPVKTDVAVAWRREITPDYSNSIRHVLLHSKVIVAVLYDRLGPLSNHGSNVMRNEIKKNLYSGLKKLSTVRPTVSLHVN